MSDSFERSSPASHQLAWHRAECWGYTADLPLWRELAGEPARQILDLGCGAGRVAIDLTRQGHRVTGVDNDQVLLDSLAADEPEIATVHADIRDFSLPGSFDLIVAPMQLLQLVAEASERLSCLHSVRRQMEPGSRFAAAFLDVDLPRIAPGENLLEDGSVATDYHRLGPETIAASSTTGLFLEDSDVLRIERRREILGSDGGSVSAPHRLVLRLRLLSLDQIADEFLQAGLGPIEWRSIAPTEVHMGSVVAIASPACQSG